MKESKGPGRRRLSERKSSKSIPQRQYCSPTARVQADADQGTWGGCKSGSKARMPGRRVDVRVCQPALAWLVAWAQVAMAPR